MLPTGFFLRASAWTRSSSIGGMEGSGRAGIIWGFILTPMDIMLSSFSDSLGWYCLSRLKERGWRAELGVDCAGGLTANCCCGCG